MATVAVKRERDEIDDHQGRKRSNTNVQKKCPHLVSIKREFLDFDFEKVCSISLSNQNVYACLVCGKFFQGRGRHTHAYTHSVQMFHHVFLNLYTNRIYCLPGNSCPCTYKGQSPVVDNYEVIDSSLTDIIQAISPAFTKLQIENLDRNKTLAKDVHGVAYLPGKKRA